MQLNKDDRNKCGIYCIKNTVNNKVYIGKAKNIYARIRNHIYALKVKSKDENRHLINAWYKYGEENFIYFIVEELEFNEELLAKRELYWITTYNSIDRSFGYNLRMDSSTKMIVHPQTLKLMSESNIGENNPNYGNKWSDEQKQKMSKIKKQQYAEGKVNINIEACKKGVRIRNEKWEKDPSLKEEMIKKVKEKNSVYEFHQYSKKGELIRIWENIDTIIKENPDYKKHNIYSAASGAKPTIYGYVWKKVLKKK